MEKLHTNLQCSRSSYISNQRRRWEQDSGYRQPPAVEPSAQGVSGTALTLLNSDQGSQFTSSDFKVLLDANVKISMDGRGRWIDNRMIERLWRSLKYECVCLSAFDTGSDARKGIGAWISYYNERRPHSSHGFRTPAEANDIANGNLKATA